MINVKVRILNTDKKELAQSYLDGVKNYLSKRTNGEMTLTISQKMVKDTPVLFKRGGTQSREGWGVSNVDEIIDNHRIKNIDFYFVFYNKYDKRFDVSWQDTFFNSTLRDRNEPRVYFNERSAKSMFHELTHCIIHKLSVNGAGIVDQLDMTNGIAYWNNDKPLAKEGNYATCYTDILRCLPYWTEKHPLKAQNSPKTSLKTSILKTILLTIVNKLKNLKTKLEEKKIFDFIAQEEGFREKAYRDTQGILTIGIGTRDTTYKELTGNSLTESTTITRSEASELLWDYFNKYMGSNFNTIRTTLDINSQCGVLSFLYNVGPKYSKDIVKIGTSKTELAKYLDGFRKPKILSSRRDREISKILS